MKKREMRRMLFAMIDDGDWNAKDIAIEARNVEEAVCCGKTLSDLEVEDMPLLLSDPHREVKVKLSRWLDVDVEIDGDIQVVDGNLFAQQEGKRDYLIVFPLDETVELETRGLPTATELAIIRGYRVKPKVKTSWDVVSPRCHGCNEPTEYGEPVTVEFGVDEKDGEERPYAVIYGKCCRP